MAADVKIRLAVEGGAQANGEITGVGERLDRLNGSIAKTAHYGAGLAILLPTVSQLTRFVLDSADAITTLNNRLALVSGSASQAAKAQAALFDIAQSSRTSFLELGNTYASIARAGQQMGIAQDRLLTVTQAIANAMTIGGGSAESMRAALVQLSQGLASGALRGDELNSVMEQAPRLAQALADGMGVTTGELRKMGEQGQITAQKVIGALENSAPRLAKEIGSATLTMGQAFTVLGNSAARFVSEADKATSASNIFARAMQSMAGAIDTVGDTIRENETAFAVIGGSLAGAAAIAGVGALGSGLLAVAGAVGTLGVALLANPAVLALLGIGAAVGGAVALARASARTADGIRESIAALEQANAVSEKALANAAGRPGPQETIRAVIAGRREEIAKLRQELALLNSESNASPAEDARLAAGTAAFAAQRAAAKELLAIRDKLDGVDQNYVSTVDTLVRALQSGALAQDEFDNLLKRVADQHNKVGEAAKRQSAQYGQLLDSYARVADATAVKLAAERDELATGVKRSDAEMQYAQVLRDAAAGKVKLADLVRAGTLAKLRANIATQTAIDLARDEARWKEEAAKAIAAVTLAELDGAEALAKQVAAQREHNATIGKTAEQLAALERAKLDDALATAEQNLQAAIGKKVNAETLAAITLQVEELRKLKALKEEGVIKQAAVDTAKAAAAEWQRTADSIYQGLTDSLYRAFESGKGFFKTFWDGIRNLFKTTVLRLSIDGVMRGSGLSALAGTAGMAQAATGAGGGLGSLGSIAGLFGAGSSAFGSGLGAGFGALFGEAGLAGGLSAGATAIGAGNIMAGLGTLAGALGPIAAIGGLLYMGLKRGPKQTTGSGIEGTASSSGFSGLAYTDWRQKGGWFRSDKTGRDNALVGGELQGVLDAGIGAAYATIGEYARVLGLPVDAVKGYATQFRVAWGATEEENKKAVEAATAKLAEDLAGRFRPALAPFQTAGEELSATFARLAGLETFSEQLNQFGGVVSRLANLSVDARESFIALAGGMESLAAQARGYAENYYSRDELAGLKAAEIQKALADAGVTTDIASREQFRALVESRDVATESGRTQLAALLHVADSFAGLTDYLAETGKSLSSTSAQAPAFQALGSIFSSSAMQQINATNAVKASVDAVRAAIEKAAAEAAAKQTPVWDPYARPEVSTGA